MEESGLRLLGELSSRSSAEVSGVLEQSSGTMVMTMARIIVLVLACCHGKYHGTRAGLDCVMKRCHSICYCIAKD